MQHGAAAIEPWPLRRVQLGVRTPAERREPPSSHTHVPYRSLHKSPRRTAGNRLNWGSEVAMKAVFAQLIPSVDPPREVWQRRAASINRHLETLTGYSVTHLVHRQQKRARPAKHHHASLQARVAVLVVDTALTADGMKTMLLQNPIRVNGKGKPGCLRNVEMVELIMRAIIFKERQRRIVVTASPHLRQGNAGTGPPTSEEGGE
mmetsp:Transcript_42794/g.91196  ORF Transcript_42794/g.91196 Transcript_42794/m.91196 type:complete len:205 (-) Transcript_42794:89-703(-)